MIDYFGLGPEWTKLDHGDQSQDHILDCQHPAEEIAYHRNFYF